MDLATVIGIIVGSTLLGWAMFADNAKVFMSAHAAMIIGGGCLSTLLVAFPLRNVMGLPGVLKKVFFAETPSPHRLIADLVKYAEIARRDGILSLESMTGSIQDKFIVKGIQMAVDGTDPELIQQILEGELESLEGRHADGRSLFETVGRYAPAYGIIGTVIGLVLMLSQMEDTSKIGEGMAVAFLATLYGAIAANLICLPFADKLRIRSKEEALMKQIVIMGVMSIQSGDNPRIVEQKLKTFLPPSAREQEEEKAE
jgi:chemotaxis protein MotA